MWEYDLETLAFLEVNHAAVEKYGYTREEFLKMTLKDIRPSEDLTRLQDNVAQGRLDLQPHGAQRHALKDGRIIDVEITSNGLMYHGRKAALMVVQDITDRKRAGEELIIANKELVIQNEEKEKRAAELIIANKELLFQNEEKEKRAAELIIANKELVVPKRREGKAGGRINHRQ